MILIYIPKADKTGEYRHKVTQLAGKEFPGKTVEYRAADAWRPNEMETKDCDGVIAPDMFAEIATAYTAAGIENMRVINFVGPVTTGEGYVERTLPQPGDDSASGGAADDGKPADDDEVESEEDDEIALQMLDHSAREIEPLLDSMNDAGFLERLLFLEEKGKGRKTVTKLIDERLSALQ